MSIATQRHPVLETFAALSSARSLAALDGFCRSVWSDWGDGRLTDEQAQTLAETIEARRREIRGVDRLAVRAPNVTTQAIAGGRPSHFPPKRRPPRLPDRRASIERRRRLAASGPMPPALACRFTTGQLSVLRIVADAVRDHGACRITVGEIAARAGVCVRLAQDALRLAAADGLVTIEERRRDKRRICRTSCGLFRANGWFGSSVDRRNREGAKKCGPRIKVLKEPHSATASHAVNSIRMQPACGPIGPDGCKSRRDGPMTDFSETGYLVRTALKIHRHLLPGERRRDICGRASNVT